MSELPICDFCKNTGVHLCPDVAEPILVSCSHKQCPITKLQQELDEARAKINEAVVCPACCESYSADAKMTVKEIADVNLSYSKQLADARAEIEKLNFTLNCQTADRLCLIAQIAEYEAALNECAKYSKLIGDRKSIVEGIVEKTLNKWKAK